MEFRFEIKNVIVLIESRIKLTLKKCVFSTL